MRVRYIPLSLFAFCVGAVAEFDPANVIYAVNCGGQSHQDVHGVVYSSDPVQHIGVASDYGIRLHIQRVESHDAILYQTERYHTSDFSYELPILKDDGEYTLVLKFCEVYFQAAEQKVFDVLLNTKVIVSELDIWKEAGGIGVAHDEAISFKVKGNSIILNNNARIDMNDGLRITFAKGLYDNPKINAFYIYKGPKSDIPQLLDVSQDSEAEEDIEEEQEVKIPETRRYAEGPPVEDPYADQDSSHMLIPILVALACFFPILFCLCKM